MEGLGATCKGQRQASSAPPRLRRQNSRRVVAERAGTSLTQTSRRRNSDLGSAEARHGN